jgi:hypothetical protein
MSRPKYDPVRYALTRAARRDSLLSPRYALGRALQAAENALVAALGGPAAVSPQQRSIIALVVRTELLVGHYDLWLTEQADLTTPTALAVVAARRGLADSLSRYLLALGLERRQPVKSLNEWMADALTEPLASENATTSATGGQEHASEQPGESIHEENPETL